MKSFTEQARVALRKYHERGVEALRLMRADNFDGAADLMQKRRAAFHNFRTADFLASKAGWDVTEDAEIQELFAEICDFDQLLIGALGSEKEQTVLKLGKMRKARLQISKYRSGMSADFVFQQSV